jgi:hypothetical protein
LFCDTNSYIKEITGVAVPLRDPGGSLEPRRTHAESGRKALYVNAETSQFVGMIERDRNKVRLMERISLIGDESGREYLGPIGGWPAAQRPAAA